MSDYFLTMADGLEIDLQHADLDDIDVVTVAEQLAKINRFIGATCRPYSVAEHSLLVLDILERYLNITDPKVLMLGLMHDAHEVLVGDVATPVKHMLGRAWQATEDALHMCMLRRFGLVEAHLTHRHTVKTADLMALCIERTHLMPSTQPNGTAPTPWDCLMHAPDLSAAYDLQHPMHASNTWKNWAETFIDRFAELNAQMEEKHAA